MEKKYKILLAYIAVIILAVCLLKTYVIAIVDHVFDSGFWGSFYNYLILPFVLSLLYVPVGLLHKRISIKYPNVPVYLMTLIFLLALAYMITKSEGYGWFTSLIFWGLFIICYFGGATWLYLTRPFCPNCKASQFKTKIIKVEPLPKQPTIKKGQELLHAWKEDESFNRMWMNRRKFFDKHNHWDFFFDVTKEISYATATYRCKSCNHEWNVEVERVKILDYKERSREFVEGSEEKKARKAAERASDYEMYREAKARKKNRGVFSTLFHAMTDKDEYRSVQTFGDFMASNSSIEFRHMKKKTGSFSETLEDFFLK